jgi:hypothetical protein
MPFHVGEKFVSKQKKYANHRGTRLQEKAVAILKGVADNDV